MRECYWLLTFLAVPSPQYWFSGAVVLFLFVLSFSVSVAHDRPVDPSSFLKSFSSKLSVIQLLCGNALIHQRSAGRIVKNGTFLGVELVDTTYKEADMQFEHNTARGRACQ